MSKKNLQEVESVVIRFAGDSGDGMQTVGEQFTDSSALAGNDISTFPDFPAEIRAPAGTLPGVSGFQVQFGSKEILTPGDAPDALVAMNPAALKVNLADLIPSGLLVVNTEEFTKANLDKAGYESNPLEDEELFTKYEVIQANFSDLTKEALKETSLKPSEKERCKNFFALGFMYWVYSRSLEPTENFLNAKWGKRNPEIAAANITVLKAGYYFGETTETSRSQYSVASAPVEKGRYRKLNGNQGIVMGLIAASKQCGRDILYAGYPITPASPVLEGLAAYKEFGIKTVQAEDEIAAIGIALGASYTGKLAVTATSGPGLCLKSEFIGLAVSTELPMVICNVQRGGPSTGLPTKTEQGDLLQSLFGRNGDSPVPVVAAYSPGDCFYAAMEATRIALKYSTPVILLSDLYIANGSEPWKIPSADSLPEITCEFAKEGEPYVTFKRDPETLSRTQAIPGQKGLQHRVGGLEKDESGTVCYDPENHEKMVNLREAKVQAIANDLPPIDVNGDKKGKVVVLGWGGTYGSITAATNNLQTEGYSVSSINLTHLNPLPKDLEAILKAFDTVLIPEQNLGHLAMLIRSKFLIDAISFPKVQGKPFTVTEIQNKVLEYLK